MSKKNNLDERQEQTLLKIESRSFWLAFWLLVAAMIIQEIAFKGDWKTFAGEAIVLFITSIYLLIGCLKNGIWDRKLQPKASTNLLASLCAGLAVGIVNFIVIYRNYPDKPIGSIAGAIFSAVFTFALTFILLSISARAVKKKNEELNQEPEEEDEI